MGAAVFNLSPLGNDLRWLRKYEPIGASRGSFRESRIAFLTNGGEANIK